MTEPPTITVAEDLDTGEFVLRVTSYNMTAPAGPRLFKTPPHPDIKFRHDTPAAAMRDAAALQTYIDTLWPKKAMSKAQLRRHAAD